LLEKGFKYEKKLFLGLSTGLGESVDTDLGGSEGLVYSSFFTSLLIIG
jgi:hypothetical protein